MIKYNLTIYLGNLIKKYKVICNKFTICSTKKINSEPILLSIGIHLLKNIYLLFGKYSFLKCKMHHHVSMLSKESPLTNKESPLTNSCKEAKPHQ